MVNKDGLLIPSYQLLITYHYYKVGDYLADYY